ncbi:unnamed protein product [Lasius platythorax]|uniref:Uncharacterized protein n=1 Tax=Lasius platythorax TaxID=488582 RepID=A0AAV2NW46_9HYME
MCYVNEDAITLTTPKLIENREIGRYFCKFEDTHYVPNEMLARLYPQDTAITAKTTTSENLDDRNVLIDSKARLTRRRKLSSDEFFLSRCIWRCTRQHRGWMKCRTSMINKAERNNLALYDRNLSRLYSSVANVVEVYADGDARQNSFMYAAVI